MLKMKQYIDDFFEFQRNKRINRMIQNNVIYEGSGTYNESCEIINLYNQMKERGIYFVYTGNANTNHVIEFMKKCILKHDNTKDVYINYSGNIKIQDLDC
jgi:succinyl-CoA synthetase beta subunit